MNPRLLSQPPSLLHSSRLDKHFSSIMPFNKLHADVLLHIFSLNDVYTILSLSSVSRSLHTIAYTKQLWVLVVQDLSLRGFIGPGNSWPTFSTEELINEVRRPVVGPRTWNRGAMPSIQRHIDIPLDHDSGQTGWLTHGGRYIVFHHRHHKFELWDVLSRSRIWALDSPTLDVSAWEIDLSARAGHAAVCLFCGSPPYYGTPWNPVVIVDVDLQTGLSSEVFRFASALPATVPSLRDFAFTGDLFICIGGFFNGFFLVNWRTAQFIGIDKASDDQLGRSFASFPGHIVLIAGGTTVTTRSQERALIYSLASLKPHWKPLCNLTLDTPTNLASRITPIALTPPLDAFARRISKIAIRESALRDDVYTLTITSSDRVLVPPPSPSPSILERIRNKMVKPQKLWVETRTRYRLFAPRNAAQPVPPPTLLDVFRKPFDAHWRLADIAPSGYGVGWGPIQPTPSPYEGRIVFFHYLRDLNSASFRTLSTTDEPGIVLGKFGSVRFGAFFPEP
ncbi:hypothetical protein C8R46DRAFT_1255098 [Mycena filopes]|nr:hypothetical protein C8R46DRAFT_1255098 [Mycena filopes]